MNVILIILNSIGSHFVGVIMKVIIIGDSHVGKTSLLNRWIYGYRYEPVVSNIGAAFFTKRVEIDSVVQDVSYSFSFFLLITSYPAATLGHSRTRKISESLPHVLPVFARPPPPKQQKTVSKKCILSIDTNRGCNGVLMV